MQCASGTEYCRTLQEAATRASTAIEEIYDDLQQNIDQICLVPSSPRSTLAKQVESLYNVCEMAGILNRHSRECQRILELRDLSASIDPSMERTLQAAHQKIRKCTDFLPRECIDLAKEAATWGVSSAAGRDQKKLAFLTDISQGNDESFLKLVADGFGTPLFSADVHPYHGIANYYHINTHALPDAPAWQVSLAENLNHTEISKEAYDLLKNFENVGKVVEIGGRVLLAAGVVLDALELCSTIDDDLHDADRKIGKKTYSSIASIGGRWTGGVLGAKGGAMLGATIGTAILPGPGTAIGGVVGGVVLGVVGSSGGSALGRWVVDITAVE